MCIHKELFAALRWSSCWLCRAFFSSVIFSDFNSCTSCKFSDATWLASPPTIIKRLRILQLHQSFFLVVYSLMSSFFRQTARSSFLMWWLALPRFFRLIGGCCCSWWWRQILSLSPAGEIIAILSHPGGAGDTLWHWLQAIDLKMLQVHSPLRRVSHTLTCGSLFCLGKLEWGWFMAELWRGWPGPVA